MRASDHRYRQHQRAFDLALRMLRHEVLTSTICEWTGLSGSHVRKLFKSYLQGARKRRRGVRPFKLETFLVSSRRRSDATRWAHFCEALRVLPLHHLRDPKRTLPGVERGHLLCAAFERFKAWERASAPMTLDQAIMLLMAFSEGDVLKLMTCSGCGARHLVDRLSTRIPQCEWCAASSRLTPAAEGKVGASEEVMPQVSH
jgi:hypothetical protein